MSAVAQIHPDEATVLTKAVLNTAEQLGLNQEELGTVLGINRSSVSRMNSTRLLDPEKKEWELALLLIRVFRGLFALTDGDQTWMKHFMNVPNTATGGVPKAQIQTTQGLVEVVQFLDAIRGKV